MAVAFIMVYYLPVVSPPSLKPWLRPTLVAAFKDSGSMKIYLYNPHSDNIRVLEVWSEGSGLSFTCAGSSDCTIGPRTYEELTIFGSASSVLLRFDTDAWMEVRFG